MKFLANLLQKFFRLPPSDRRLLAQVWLALQLVDLALRLLPFVIVRTWCSSCRLQGERAPAVSPPFPLARCIQLLDVANRYSLAGTTCLTETLAIAWLMGRWGIITTLRIGVARPNGALAAHAWLEHNGHILFDRELATAYVPLQPCHHQVP